MATVRDPAAHTGPSLDAEPPLAGLAALHGGLQRLRATPLAAAPLDAGTAVVEEPPVGAPAAVPIRGNPGGEVRHGPRRYGWSGRPARSPHIV